jgi:hypothetical protein
VSILENASVLWNASIANGDTIGVSHDITTTVAAGDSLYFVVNKGDGNNYCDSTAWDPTITYQ